MYYYSTRPKILHSGPNAVNLQLQFENDYRRENWFPLTRGGSDGDALAPPTGGVFVHRPTCDGNMKLHEYEADKVRIIEAKVTRLQTLSIKVTVKDRRDGFTSPYWTKI